MTNQMGVQSLFIVLFYFALLFQRNNNPSIDHLHHGRMGFTTNRQFKICMMLCFIFKAFGKLIEIIEKIAAASAANELIVNKILLKLNNIRTE